jgi:FtsP/CotA-like multicopper oxidase with cupredoxin domain
MRASVTNSLSSDTSIHWHGIRIRNDMDGVPPVTQEAIVPGSTFDYSFVAPDPGTYWYHSHSGLQADRGLFGALIVEDPHDDSGADADAVLVLDDWVDGLGTTPDAIMAAWGSGSGSDRRRRSHGCHVVDLVGTRRVGGARWNDAAHRLSAPSDQRPTSQ